jgi:hypothetical protein
MTDLEEAYTVTSLFLMFAFAATILYIIVMYYED